MPDELVWVRKGYCRSCGKCCQGKMLLDQFPGPLKLIALGVVGENIEDECPFLGWRPDGKSFCKQYLRRPSICRLYPDLSHFADGLLFKECTYFFEQIPRKDWEEENRKNNLCLGEPIIVY